MYLILNVDIELQNLDPKTSVVQITYVMGYKI